MKEYIRQCIVKAEPMTAYEFDDYKNREHSGKNDDGYLVVYPDGYKSWCPKAQFEAAGRPIDGMTFGMAIEAMKKGRKVARKGWNGKGMYIWINPESTVLCQQYSDDPHLKKISDENGSRIDFLASIRMKTATGEVLTGWLASQTDMLSEDWAIVD